MVKNKHMNSTKYLILMIVFISLFVLSLSGDAFGQTILLDDENTNYKFQLDQKSLAIDNDSYMDNKNEKFAYGIMEFSDVFIILLCILIFALEIFILLRSKVKKHAKKH
jgi:hypothetical protein